MKSLGIQTAFCVFAFLFLGRAEAFFGSMCHSYGADEPSSSQSFKCRRQEDRLYVDGLIESVMYDEMALWGTPDYQFVGMRPLKEIHLNSKGGLMFDSSGVSNTAVDIMRLIQEKKLETYAGAECKSACVPVFASGLKRSAKLHTAFMVHNPRMSGSRAVFLRKKCGEKFENPDCAQEILELTHIQNIDMDRYFSLLEAEGVSFLLRQDYLKGAKDLLAPGNGNLLGIQDYYFDGRQALDYGLALELKE